MAVLPLEIKNDDRILIVAPHPDDECIGAGGLMSKYPNQCEVLVMTDGRHGDPAHTHPSEETVIRRKEFITEMEYLGIKNYYFMEYEDGTLMGHEDILKDFDISPYAKIFVTHEGDNHPDHAAACIALYEKLKEKTFDKKEIYLYETHIPMHDVTHFLDITDVIDIKKKSIYIHQSQTALKDWSALSISLAKYRACQQNEQSRYYEVYAKIGNKDYGMDGVKGREKQIAKKNNELRMLYQWNNYLSQGMDISDIVKKHGANRVTVYGGAELGRKVAESIIRGGIDVIEILDKRGEAISINGINCKRPDEGNINTDMVIVTALSGYEDIENELKEMGYKQVIYLRRLFDDIAE